jgi:hypothetical protein
VAETIVGRADCLEGPSHQLDDLGGVLDRGLDDGELVAAEPGDEIAGPDAFLEARGHRFEQLVADHVSERIVDALEFVDVDVEHRQVLAFDDIDELLLEPFVEQRAVWQVGQRVVMRKMPDLLLGAHALGDVFVGSQPTVLERLIDDLDQSAVRGFDDTVGDLAQSHIPQDGRDKRIDIALERAGLFSVRDEIAKGKAWLHEIVGKPIHRNIALVTDNEPLR